MAILRSSFTGEVMHPLVNIGLRAAQPVADSLALATERLDRIRISEDESGNPVTNIELEIEETIAASLEKTHPGHGLESRLSGLIREPKGDDCWLLDPLFGLRNFLAGLPYFGLSLAHRSNKVTRHAVLILPLLRDEYVASRGAGAQLNGKRIRVDQTRSLDGALVATPAWHSGQAKLLDALQEAGCSTRTTGCSLIDMALVASGGLRAGWATGQQPQQPLEAANLILLEAGGLAGSTDGSPGLSSASELFFANPACYKQLVKLNKPDGQ